MDSTSVTGTVLDYNVYWLTSPYTLQINWNGVPYTSLADFKTGVPGKEIHGVQGDPLFISPAAPVLDPYAITVVTGDYHINMGGSPVIDSADSDAPGMPSTDLDGSARLDDPSTANTGVGAFDYYDRGAYEFQPGSFAPALTTQAATAIGATSVTGNGTIISLGSVNPTQHGFVWDTSANPTIALSTKTEMGSRSATGAFAGSITGLSPSTLYHVRAYATNTVGTSYGNDVTFTTGGGTPVTFNSGSGNWVAPAGVTSVIVEVWGGGGRGGSASSPNNFGGGGGGGGGYSKSTVTVVPGNSYPYVVGAGSTTTSAGGNSSFNTTSVVAFGGNSVADNSGTGASVNALGTGDTKYIGGGGAAGGGSTSGGGGGSSAGTASNGNTATSSTGANAPSGGGNGGSGKSNSSGGNGTAGTAPGGGGGGAYRSTFTSGTGGSGANGRVQITYVAVPISTTTSVNCGAGTPSVIYGGNITCVATVAAASGTTSPTGSVSWVTSGTGGFVTSPCTLSGSGGSATCSVTYTPTLRGSGSHTITATYGGSVSFLASNGNQVVTVTAKALTMSGLTVPASKIYDATTSAVVSGTPLLAASEAFGTGTTSDGKPYTGDTVSITGTAAGAYNSKDVATAANVTFSGLSLTGAHAGNYTLTMQTPALATVTKKALTMSGLSASAKIYDGSTSAVVTGTPTLAASEAAGSGTTSDGKPYTGDTVNISGTPAGTYNSKDVLTAATVTFSGLTLGGTHANNYTLTIQSPSAGTITPKALTMTGLTAPASKVYDGTTNSAFGGAAALLSPEAVGTGTTSDGKPYIGDAVNISGPSTASYNSKHVNVATTVSFSGLSLINTHAPNYTLTNQTIPSVITPKPITVNAITNSRQYDGTTTAAAIPTNSGVASGDTASFIETYSNKNFGSGNKTLVPSGVVTDGNGGDNYSYTFVNFLTGTITKLPVVVDAVDNTKVYDGTTTAAATPTNSGVAVGDIANFIEAYTDKHIGSGNKTLVASGTVSDGNSGLNYSYGFNNFTTGTITAKALTVTVVANTKVYDGTNSAAALPTHASLGTGDTAGFTEVYTDPNVGTSKVLSPLGVVADGNGGANYTYTYISSPLGTITKAEPTVTAVGGSFLFTGNPIAGSGSAVGVLSEVLSPAVTLSYSGTGSTVYGPTATSPTAIGTYAVTASFAGNSNYNPKVSAPAALTIDFNTRRQLLLIVERMSLPIPIALLVQ